MATGSSFSADSPRAGEDARLQHIEDLVNASRRLVRVVNAILTEDGMREDSWRVLRLLSHSHGIAMGEISAHLSLPTTSTTRLVDDLVDASLVFRRGATDDGRKALVHLSRDGAERLRRLDAILAARLAELERELPADARRVTAPA